MIAGAKSVMKVPAGGKFTAKPQRRQKVVTARRSRAREKVWGIGSLFVVREAKSKGEDCKFQIEKCKLQIAE